LQFFDLPEIPLVDRFSLGNVLFVPASMARLVAADERDSRSSRIEGIENPVGPTFVLNPKLAQVGDPRTVNCIGVRPRKAGTGLPEKSNMAGYALPFLRCQAIPPLSELVREFDPPSHAFTMSRNTYTVKGRSRDALRFKQQVFEISAGRGIEAASFPIAQGLQQPRKRQRSPPIRFAIRIPLPLAARQGTIARSQ
jgi:hypothetical protein